MVLTYSDFISFFRHNSGPLLIRYSVLLTYFPSHIISPPQHRVMVEV